MIVTYHGKGCIKASVGERVFAFNPPSKDSSIKLTKSRADVALISVDLPDYNGIDQLAYGEHSPFVIDGPGEYELAGTFIQGVATKGADDIVNTVYIWELDDIKICHLGALADVNFSPETFEMIGEVDVLFVPTYAEGTLDAEEAHKLSTRIAPKVIIPLFHGEKGNDTSKAYLKEAGDDGAPILDKWTFKRKDIESKEGDIVVIKSF